MDDDLSGYPILDALRCGCGFHLFLWCQYCRKCHAHGTAGTETGKGGGHRVAHCASEQSPYAETGYILKEVGPLTRDNVYRYFDRRRVRGIGDDCYVVPLPS